MESKEAEESKLDVSDAKMGPDDFDDLDPIVSAFLEFSYGNELSELADDWISEHARTGGFEKKSAFEADGSGHPMEWSRLHQEYCEAIDSKLEAFCNEQGRSAKDLFEALEDAMENEEVADALPGFVKLTSYEHFCSQMESHATANEKREEAQELAASGNDPWSGEWRGLYDFNTRERDEHLQEHDVPWAVRQLVKTLMFRNGTVKGVLRYEPGNKLHRSFNFGILGQQEESFDLKKVGEWHDFHGGLIKNHFTKAMFTMDNSGGNPKITIKTRRYFDEKRTKRVKSKKGEIKESVKTFELIEDGTEMLCTEAIYWEERDEYSDGWSFKFRRVEGDTGGRK